MSLLDEDFFGITKSDVDEYKTLILQRDRLKKEETKIWLEYIRTFGELIENNYALKIECIKLKKTIAYCQVRKNRNEMIDRQEMNDYIEAEMQNYYDELGQIAEIRATKGTMVSSYEMQKIKSIYRKIALAIHPDIQPEMMLNEDIKALWEDAKDAYQRNDLVRIQEVEILVFEAVKQYSDKLVEIKIDDLEEKIIFLHKEIDNIISNEPYRYKYLLMDDEGIEEVKCQLTESQEGLEKYLGELREVAMQFNIITRLN